MNYLFIILLTCLAAFTRLAPHPPNFTPILSIALFCGVCFRSKYIFLVPLFAMLISDFILGFHSVIMYVYFSLLLIFIFGKLVTFNCTLTEVLDKLKDIDNISLKKSKYSLKKINVRLYNNSIIEDVYIII